MAAPLRPPWVRILFAGAILLLGAAIFLLFKEIGSTLSDLTAGDAVREHQAFYNFTHGRPLQLSGCYSGLDGIKYAPFAYANNTAIHVNFTPFLFAPFYRLWPSIQGCYALMLLVNYLGIAFWIVKLLRSDGGPHAAAKSALALSALLLSSGFFWTVSCKNHLPLYIGPFFFALYYFHATGKAVGYWLALALCCGVSEDSALFMLSWAGFLFWFQPGQRRKAVWTALAALVWAVFAVKVLNVWARQGMEVQEASNLWAQLHYVLSGGRMKIMTGNLLELLRAVAVFSPILVCNALLFQKKPLSCLPRVCGFVFLAPLSHWAVTVLAGGDHHWFPIFLCLLAAAVELMRGPQTRPFPEALRGRAAAALAAFVLANACGLYYGPLKLLARRELLPRLMGYPVPDDASRAAHNRRVIDFIHALPREASCDFWLDRNVMGFVADRSGLWAFPDYFGSTDFLVIDRRMPEEPFMPPDPALPQGFRIHLLPADRDFLASLAENGVIKRKNLSKIADRLVRQGTYRIIREDADMLALERLERIAFAIPAASMGIGFLRRGPPDGVATSPLSRRT